MAELQRVKMNVYRNPIHYACAEDQQRYMTERVCARACAWESMNECVCTTVECEAQWLDVR